jgi:LysR family transcriptional regulator, transcriptional activator of the cysJI operon
MSPIPGFAHLRLFRDIVQKKSIVRGAQLNGLSQSAASQHVLELERKLNTVLLDRRSRPFTLTASGKLYYELCRDLLRRGEQFQAALDRDHQVVEGSVRVASIYSVQFSEMTRLQEAFSRQYPKASMAVEYLRPERVYEAVVSERADLGLVSYPEPRKELTVLSWREEEMVLAVAPSHTLAGRSVVHPVDLNGVEFAAFDEDLPIRRHIDRFLREHAVEVNLTLHFDNIQMVKEAVRVGVAVSILPRRILTPDLEQGTLVAVGIQPQLHRPLGIIHRRRRKLNRAAESFLELLLEKPVASETPVVA